MDTIRKLYHSFSKSEVRYLRDYLNAFHHKGDNKSLELIAALEKYPDISNREMATLLYGDPQSKAFIMLKSRLVEKMLETLSLSANLQNNPLFRDDPASSEAIRLHKEIINATVLRRRGLNDLAIEILTDAAEQARKQGMPELRLTALVHLRNMSKSAEEVTGPLRAAIHEARDAYLSDLEGIELYDEYHVMMIGHHHTLTDERVREFEARLPELRARLETHYSPRAHYYSLVCQQYINDHFERLDASRQTFEELLNLLNREPGLGQRNRMGTPWFQLAQIEIKLRHFGKGLEALEQCLEYFAPKKSNAVSASIYKAFAQIYLGDAEGAVLTLGNLKWFTQDFPKDPKSGIISYLYTCTYFLTQKYKEAWELLSESEDLMQDKQGWNGGIRAFEIMLLIERGHTDMASAKIESMRKHIGKYTVEKRIHLIHRFFQQLEKNSYDFSQPSHEMQEAMKNIHLTDWEPLSYEVSRFDTWVRAKSSGKGIYELLLQELFEEAESHSTSFSP
ncbi:MAG: hypothetical protein EAZ89_03905 [Bacteroidetes bacterium]|nr:MAG: hypothetical protein EAZ89_03905 [Bacteroidota bacterium]